MIIIFSVSMMAMCIGFSVKVLKTIKSYKNELINGSMFHAISMGEPYISFYT